jgi:hypothetical protein
MIIDKSNGRLDEIKAFAKENNLLESFNNTFSNLENYSAKGCTVTLYTDFAPLSMEFSITEMISSFFMAALYFMVRMMVMAMAEHQHFLFLYLRKKQAGQFTLKNA